MKDDYLSGATVTVDLSDLSRNDISSLSYDEMDTISLDSLANLAPPTYNYGSYTYPNGVSSVSIAGSGTSIYTGINSGTFTLSPSTYSNISTWPSTETLTVNSGDKSGITVKGDTEIEGSLKVKGVDLGEMLSKIQDQLAIYQPAPELEEKWEQLRDLARQYKELVADIKEKEKIWDILQK